MDSPADSRARAHGSEPRARSGRIRAAWTIVAGVVVYRLRNLEMANLAGAGSIAVALRLPWHEIAVRTLFAFTLNVLVYLNNDYYDIADDLHAGSKDASKSRFLADHMSAARNAQWLLLGALLCVALALHGSGLIVALVFGGGACVLYSAQLKRRPYADILSMMVWGFAMPLCGSPSGSALGLALALQLGLFSGVYETIQVLRDREEDAQRNVRTTAVVLGAPRTLLLARCLMLLSSAYTLAVMHPIAALISTCALLVPFRTQAVAQYWTRVKLVLGCAWLVICATVFFAGHSGGMLYAVTRTLQF